MGMTMIKMVHFLQWIFELIFKKRMSNAENSSKVFNENFNYVYPDSEGYGKEEDFQITRQELESIQEALKKEEFRKLLSEYVDEVQVQLLCVDFMINSCSRS